MSSRIARASLNALLVGCCVGSAMGQQAGPWTIGVIDSSGAGRYSSLRFDHDGNAHLSYVVDSSGHLLKYAFWDRVQDKWFTTAIDAGASFCSLALDSQQRPHISYTDYGTDSGSRLRYAYWDGTQWNKQPVQLDSDIIAYYTSIALDPSDQPRISFYEYRGVRGSDFHIRLRIVSRNGKFWEVRTVDGSAGSGKFNSMGMDSEGRLLLAYANVDALTAGARFAMRDGSAWRLEVVDDMAANRLHVVGYSMAMAVDKAGAPHLSYWDINVPLVKYATRVKGRWTTEVVDAPAGAASNDRNAITVDEEGRPFMSYYDGRQLRLAHRESARWEVEVVDVGLTGFTSSIQIDHGEIWIAYADDGGHQLKVARRPLRTPPTEEGKGTAEAQSQAAGPGQAQRVK